MEYKIENLTKEEASYIGEKINRLDKKQPAASKTRTTGR